jgi:hypothetical protein
MNPVQPRQRQKSVSVEKIDERVSKRDEETKDKSAQRADLSLS